MLVFKDTIMGLVAGVQLSANDMLRPGDWITMPKIRSGRYSNRSDSYHCKGTQLG